MDSKDVLYIYKLLKKNNIDLWLDGGWGVDALLQKQTREHGDVDIIIQEKDKEKLLEILLVEGYKKVTQDDTSSWNFVYQKNSKKIDIHIITFDNSGNGIYGPKERNTFYPADSFKGKGLIDDSKVNCLTAKYQLESHTGYKIDENDAKDVFALCEKFNLKYPKIYEKFRNKI